MPGADRGCRGWPAPARASGRRPWPAARRRRGAQLGEVAAHAAGVDVRGADRLAVPQRRWRPARACPATGGRGWPCWSGYGPRRRPWSARRSRPRGAGRARRRRARPPAREPAGCVPWHAPPARTVRAAPDGQRRRRTKRFRTPRRYSRPRRNGSVSHVVPVTRPSCRGLPAPETMGGVSDAREAAGRTRSRTPPQPPAGCAGCPPRRARRPASYLRYPAPARRHPLLRRRGRPVGGPDRPGRRGAGPRLAADRRPHPRRPPPLLPRRPAHRLHHLAQPRPRGAPRAGRRRPGPAADVLGQHRRPGLRLDAARQGGQRTDPRGLLARPAVLVLLLVLHPAHRRQPRAANCPGGRSPTSRSPTSTGSAAPCC